MDSIFDIPELENIPRIDTIEDLCKLNEAVFSIVPHTDKMTPSTSVDFLNLYKAYKARSLFGWCHANAVFLHLLLSEYYRDSYVYNYGFQDLNITHAVVVVTLGEDKYLIDPYFCRHYEDKKGKALTLKDLEYRCKRRQTKNIVSVFGESLKAVHTPSGPENWGGAKLEESVMGGWNAITPFVYRSPGDSEGLEVRPTGLAYNKVMKDRYDSLDALLLILNKVECTRIVRKRSGELYWEFF